MAVYELDDELVMAMINQDWTAAQMDQLVDALSTQRPLPVPDMPGAVVRTTRGIAILADPGADASWVVHEEGNFGDYFWCQPAGIGRVTKVLSVGVDI